MDPARKISFNRLGLVLASAFAIFAFSGSALAISTLEGTVYDNKGNTLQDIHIELLNDYGTSINRTRTDGVGRYRFDGLSDGRFAIRVRPFQHDFYEQQRPIVISTQNIRGGEGSGTFQADFVLQPRKVAFGDKELGVVFAQEVPKEARKLYDTGIEQIGDKKGEAGFSSLQKALEIFPNYFDALHAVGVEFFTAKMYKEAIPYFLKAAEVNSKSVTAQYYIGFSLHHLGKDYDKAALNKLKTAQSMAPGSAQVLYAVGVVERSMGNYTDAEKSLLAAKKAASGSVPEIHRELSQLYGNELKNFSAAADELELYLKASDLKKDDERKTKKIIADLRAKAKGKS